MVKSKRPVEILKNLTEMWKMIRWIEDLTVCQKRAHRSSTSHYKTLAGEYRERKQQENARRLGMSHRWWMSNRRQRKEVLVASTPSLLNQYPSYKMTPPENLLFKEVP